jgi:Pyruvate/2-oxoacid:ferredoxin oxidoreductase delta subunit
MEHTQSSETLAFKVQTPVITQKKAYDCLKLFCIRHNIRSIERMMYKLQVIFCSGSGLLEKHYVAPFRDSLNGADFAKVKKVKIIMTVATGTTGIKVLQSTSKSELNN